jgi:osmotically-inducible protein OsmY
MSRVGNTRRVQLSVICRATLVSLALLASSCGYAEALRDAAGQRNNARAARVAPAPPAAATPRVTENEKEAPTDSAYQRDVETVGLLNRAWNATLESNPLAKGWVRITLVSQGKVKLEGEMPDNDINDAFMERVVRAFGVANIENHIKKFPQPCGREGKSCGQEKRQAAPDGAGA